MRYSTGEVEEKILGDKTNKKPASKSRFITNLLLTISYCAFIFIQSSYPIPAIVPDIPYLDKVLHFFGYALLSILFFRTVYHLPRISIDIKTIIFLSTLLSTLYGITDEIHQHFVPYRHADIIDMIFDGMGSVFGAFIYPYILGRFKLR